MIDPQKFGVSFSLKQCRNFGFDPEETLRWLVETAGFRRLRLMSYWNEHEKEPGVYDFAALDKQLEIAAEYGCVVSLCLGARQPRWPENHWPGWAWQLFKIERDKALLAYIQTVVERYKDQKSIISYQLENEALLKSFGERAEVDRPRLRQEFTLVKKLDPGRPVIMTTSTSWGIPLRRPVPDVVGFSYYRTLYRNNKYHRPLHFPLLIHMRRLGVWLHHRRISFIHELQLEPWGPKNIWEMPVNEQDKSMSIKHIRDNLRLARRTRLYPIDLWGGEWWYWRLKIKHDPSIWQAVQDNIKD